MSGFIEHRREEIAANGGGKELAKESGQTKFRGKWLIVVA
jgi:hypothetical protein